MEICGIEPSSSHDHLKIEHGDNVPADVRNTLTADLLKHPVHMHRAETEGFGERSILIGN